MALEEFFLGVGVCGRELEMEVIELPAVSLSESNRSSPYMSFLELYVSMTVVWIKLEEPKEH